MTVLLQTTSLVGAALILAAYVALQRGLWTSSAAGYLWFNFVGAVLLTTVAVIDRRLGFVLLEGVWAAVSLASIVRSGGPPATLRES